jgi:hypothetical protein
VGFHAGVDRKLDWNEPALETWLRYLVAWTDEDNGGFTRERDFIRAYLYEPPYHLAGEPTVASRRIAFYHALAGEYFLIPVRKRQRLAMAWLTRSGKIPADDAILLFSIPRGVRNRPGAYAFLIWLFSARTQQNVLRDNKKYNPRAFGIGGRFSSLPEVNESHLPETVPSLRDRFPEASRIIFTKARPETWEKTKNETILPWIYEHYRHAEGITDLRKRLE